MTGRPRWAPRVSRHKIAQLYRADALGLQDEELADEVGYAFLARIDSMLAATEAHRGRARCPECATIIDRQRENPRMLAPRNEVLHCAGCGWSLPWVEYHRSFRKKQLVAGGMEPFIRDFEREFPRARGYREKILLIDALIHRFHFELEGRPGRPGGVNLIGGSVREVIDFLNQLSYGPSSTPGIEDRGAAWRADLRWGRAR